MAVAGEVVFHRLFDLGFTLDMKRARELLGPMAVSAPVQPSKAAPEYVSFAAPIPLNLTSLKLELCTEDNTAVTVAARLYEIGTLAVMIRYAARGEKLNDLNRYQTLQISYGGKKLRRRDIFSLVFDAIKPVVKPALDEVFDVPVEPETYTSYCLTEAPGGSEYSISSDRPQIAGLLINENSPERLSVSEVDDILKNWHSYYRDELVVADWDAAFMIIPSGQYEDMLYTFEVANLQLMALRKYDIYLDNTLERGYEEFERLSKGPPVFAGRAREILRELGGVRMDLAKVTDEVANTAKFFGDWHLARVYMGLAGKLHISDYHKVVEEKLATLNDLYQSVLSEIDRRQNLALEVMIVILFVFEVLMAIWKR